MFKNWKIGRKVNWQVPSEIVQCYDKYKIPNYSTTIPIGDFFLSFKNLRILLLFESEIRDKTTIGKIDSVINVDIVSVVGDKPRGTNM